MTKPPGLTSWDQYRFEITIALFISLVSVIALLGAGPYGGLSPPEQYILGAALVFFDLMVAVILVVHHTARSVGTRLRAIEERVNPTIPASLRGALRRLLAHELQRHETAKSRLLNEKSRYQVDKKEMYHELTKFTEALSKKDRDSIRAVSCINIEDFQLDPFAEGYFRANVACVARGVPVRRIFLLDYTDISNPRVQHIVKTHGRSLKDASVAPGTAVKWINKKLLDVSLRDEDLALFDDCIVVRQRREDYEITLADREDVSRAAETFSQLWDHEGCLDFTELPAATGDSGGTRNP